MTISALASTTASTQAKPMGMEDFLKVLLTQLVYQDPLKPMDNQEFMAQMAQFTSLEQAEQMNEKMSTLIGNQAALQSVGLIGRSVDVSSDSGPVTGQVIALSLAGDTPSMTIRTTSGSTLENISLAQVTAVR